MYALIRCEAPDNGVFCFLVLNGMGCPVHVAGQFEDALGYILDTGDDRIALLTPGRPLVVRIKENRDGWQQRGEAPHLLFAEVDVDYSDVPEVPVFRRIDPPDLS